MNGLTRKQFVRTLCKIAEAETRDEAVALLRAARLAGRLSALDKRQLQSLREAANEKKGAGVA